MTLVRHVCLRCTSRTVLTTSLVVLALLMAGVRHEDINTKFWRRRRVPFGGRDVVLRRLCNILLISLLLLLFLHTSHQDKKEPI